MFKLFFYIIKNHSMNGIHVIHVLMKGALQQPPKLRATVGICATNEVEDLVNGFLYSDLQDTACLK